ncbi:MAG TPA: SNF2-related protein, partial [Ktedonobacterales bacterium]|nr:SNF2-related protein [Ktedonobacterales bacterium]
MSRWQRLISRFFPQEADIIAEVDATEDGDSLAIRLAVSPKAQQGDVWTMPVTAIDVEHGRVRTLEGDFRVKDEGRRIIAAIAPEGHTTLRHQSRTPDGAVHVDEAHLPDALRDLRAVADQGHVVESSNARAIKLADRRPLQYEFQVDFADEESLAVTPQIVSADGKVRLDPLALQPPPPESPQRGRRDASSEPPDMPRWVRQGKTYYPTPAATPEEIAPYTRQHVVLRGDDVPFFLARQLKQLGRNGRVVASDAVKDARVASNALEPVSVLDLDDEGWLSVDVTYRGEPEAGRSGAGPVPGVTFTREEIDALPADARYIRRDNTWIPIDRKAEKKLHEALSQVERKLGAQRDDQGRLRVAPGKGDETRRMLLNVAEIDEGVAFQKFLADLAGFRQIDPLDPPQGLTATLRPYQVEGFRWLAFLRKYYLNGVLADDMGLGKTIELLSLLQYAKEHPDAETPDPTLIICPTSCVDNWIDEASKFTPGLRIRRYIGNDRATAFADSPDVLVTTYETLRRDMGALLRQPWDYVILDEAQKIKNPITETARACRHLLARHRLAVTGTPIENKLDELWAQFDFLMPG